MTVLTQRAAALFAGQPAGMGGNRRKTAGQNRTIACRDTTCIWAVGSHAAGNQIFTIVTESVATLEDSGHNNMDQSRHYLAYLTSQELIGRAVEYRRMAAVTFCWATKQALNRLAARYALLAKRREIEERLRANDCPDQSELSKLIRLAEQATADQPDPVTTLANVIKAVVEGAADPYLIGGVLVEGSIHTLQHRVPTERQAGAAAALLKLMEDRLRASGFLDDC